MPDQMPQAYAPGIAPSNAQSMLSAMHVRTYGRTNEESILRQLKTDHRNLAAEPMEKCAECGRVARTRGVCGTCYERHRWHGTLDELAPRSRHRHTPEHCPICDEVNTLTAHGWDARTIVTALQRTPEYVVRHLRQWQHPLTQRFVPLETEANRARARRKATA